MSASLNIHTAGSSPDTSKKVGSSEWIECFSKTYQRKYWFNQSTGEKSWDERGMCSSSDSHSLGMKRDRDQSEQPQHTKNGPTVSSTKDANKRPKNVNNNPAVTLSSAFYMDTSKRLSGKKLPEKVAVIVPFRDLQQEQLRGAQMKRFIPEMTRFLSSSGVEFHIYIIEQSMDDRKFNRGKLLNIGFELAKAEKCTNFIFHDVDLIPSSDLLSSYTVVPKENPIHIARVWDRYNGNPSYFGGVVAFSGPMFQAINGFPNNFWGEFCVGQILALI